MDSLKLKLELNLEELEFKIGDEVYIKTTDYESSNGGYDFSEFIWEIIEIDGEFATLRYTEHESEFHLFFESNDPKPNSKPFRVVEDVERVYTLKYPISLLESI